MLAELEAQDRIEEITGRRTEIQRVDCDCDYSDVCYLCSGRGTYRVLVYSSCQHLVQEVDDEECENEGCADKERMVA